MSFAVSQVLDPANWSLTPVVLLVLTAFFGFSLYLVTIRSGWWHRRVLRHDVTDIERAPYPDAFEAMDWARQCSCGRTWD